MVSVLNKGSIIK